jgi:MoaA/NifB/PqqE/SkfB family radical SAM enzyme
LIFDIISKSKDKENITFYWWNPLLHPDIIEIIRFCIKNKIKWVWLLTNTFLINNKFINELMDNGLNYIWFYFNSFNKANHNKVVNNWIKFGDLLKNIEIIKKSWIWYKTVIHVNKLNIWDLFKDLIILNKIYLVNNVDFVNIIPFEEPFETNKDILFYEYKDYENEIKSLFKIVKKLNINCRFIKFRKDFFIDNLDFFNEEESIMNQIPNENLTCKKNFDFNNKCIYCFMKDTCKR